MRLKITKSKNAASLYVIKDVIRNGKRTTKIVEKLGTLEELKKKLKNLMCLLKKVFLTFSALNRLKSLIKQ